MELRCFDKSIFFSQKRWSSFVWVTVLDVGCAVLRGDFRFANGLGIYQRFADSVCPLPLVLLIQTLPTSERELEY